MLVEPRVILIPAIQEKFDDSCCHPVTLKHKHNVTYPAAYIQVSKNSINVKPYINIRIKYLLFLVI